MENLRQLRPVLDVMKYEVARGSFGSDFWVSHVYRLNSPDVLSLSKSNPGALGPEITNYNNRSLALDANGNIEGIDPDIKPYQSRDLQVGQPPSWDEDGRPQWFCRKDLLHAIGHRCPRISGRKTRFL